MMVLAVAARVVAKGDGCIAGVVGVVSYDGETMATDGVITHRHAQGKNWEGV